MMTESSPRFVILHGLDGSSPGHWQRWLEEELVERGFRVDFPNLPAKESPQLKDWIEPVHQAISEAGPDVVVIAHSLGAISWLQYASGSGAAPSGRVLLVAPPGLSELDEFGRVWGHRDVSFRGDRVRSAAKSIVMAGSLADPVCRRGFVDEYSRPLGIAPIYLPDRFRHVNLESGHGPWPFALRWSLVGTKFASLSSSEETGQRIFQEYPEPVARR